MPSGAVPWLVLKTASDKVRLPELKFVPCEKSFEYVAVFVVCCSKSILPVPSKKLTLAKLLETDSISPVSYTHLTLPTKA